MSLPHGSLPHRRLVGALAVGALALATVVAPVTAAQAASGARSATIPTPKTCYTPLVPGTPSITSFSFSPHSVNVKSGPRKVTFTVKAKDTGATPKNIRFVSVSLTSPTISKVTRGASALLSRVSGTAKNGTWRGSAVIPRWTNNGTWKVTYLSVSDAGGGGAFYAPTYSWNPSWPKTLSVTSTPDVTPPTFTSLKFSKSSVSTKSKVAKITVTASTKDSRSGAVTGSVSVQYLNKTHPQYAYVFLAKSGGSRTHAKLKGTLLIPRWLGKTKHTWQARATVSDAMANSRSYTYKQLKAKHFAHTLKVKSSSDTAKPTLSSLAFTPKSIDVRNAGKNVTVTVGAKDAGAGVTSVFVTFTSATFGSYGGVLRKVSGSTHSGSWRGKVAFPKCYPPPGTYKANVTIYDGAGNYTSYTSAQLAAKHKPVNLTVVSNDSTPPTTLAITGTVPAGGGTVLKFSEPVIMAAAPSTFLQVYGGLSFSLVAGTWACKNGSGVVVTCTADGANVRSMQFTPSTSFDVGSSYSVSSSLVYPHTGLFDTSGNEMSFLYSTFNT